MNCPIDSTTLQMSERQGIEIDYCPECRGVWLDRGELDKLIERSASTAPAAAPAPPPRQERDDDRRYDERRHDDDHRYDKGYGKKRKKESFLSEIFDFG